MGKVETSKASRARTDLAGVATVALPAMVGLCLAIAGPAAADAPNKQSFTAAQAETAPANVMSFKGATTPAVGNSRIRPALVGSAAARADGAPNAAAVAAFTAATPQQVSAAARPTEQPRLGAALVPTNGAPAANASRPAEQLQAAMAARPATAGSEALLHPVTIAAPKNNAALAPASTSSSGPAAAAAAVVPTPARAPAGGAVRTAMLTPSSTIAADRSATTELLKSKAAVNALRKARHDAAAHQR